MAVRGFRVAQQPGNQVILVQGVVICSQPWIRKTRPRVVLTPLRVSWDMWWTVSSERMKPTQKSLRLVKSGFGEEWSYSLICGNWSSEERLMLICASKAHRTLCLRMQGCMDVCVARKISGKSGWGLYVSRLDEKLQGDWQPELSSTTPSGWRQ